MTQATQKKKYTSAQAEALFLEQLKRTNPSESVRAVISELEKPKRRRRHKVRAATRQSRHKAEAS